MRLLYTLGIYFYTGFIKFASAFNGKAAQWTQGRKHWEQKLKNAGNLTGCIWFHCASLGEFEQGRPLLEKLKQQYPGKPVLLTFFSPSGYNIRKNYPHADYISYLPADTGKNARKFLEIAQPHLAIFVKYEVWHNFYKEIAKQKIPLLLISAIFRKEQVYFKPYGKWFLHSLHLVYKIYAQDEESTALLKSAGINHCTVSGDTRFDRVLEIASQSKNLDLLEEFSKNYITVVAGSTWPADEDILAQYAATHPEVKWIIAPHEIDENRINSICKKFKGAARWSDKERATAQNVWVIDSIGLLSSLYKYGDMAYVGGGFGAGIHNTLEPAVYGIPVIFGPKFQKFKEAKELISCKGAQSVANYNDLESILNTLTNEKKVREEMAKNAGDYVSQNAGATQLILSDIVKIIS